MAEAAVRSALQKLDDVELKKALKLYRVSDHVETMKVDLLMVIFFLEDARSISHRNPIVEQWVEEVRDAACRIEDAMDAFLIEIEEYSRKNSGIKRHGGHPLKLDWFFDEIKEVQVTLETIDKRTTNSPIRDIGGGSEEESVVPFRPTKPHEIDVSEVVGFEADEKKIIEHLLDRSISRRIVLTIVGMGGIGKTTLAAMVYKRVEFKEEFDYCTWLSISQEFSLANLLREILSTIDPQKKKKEVAITDEDLAIELARSLSEKRYLIILDDVWTVSLWDQLKIALPDMNNGSRVLITSRFLDVAIAADPKTPPHKIFYLTEEQSLAPPLKKGVQWMQKGDIGGGSEEESVVPFRPSKPHEIDVSEVVGFEADEKKIIEHLLDRSISRRTVLTIVGMGGIGKTTLAAMIYKRAELERQFDCCTWLSISPEFHLINLLREFLYSIEPQMKNKNPIETEEVLLMELNKSLCEKRYLVILDDVWTTDLFYHLQTALPDRRNGSRVLITSRFLNIAITANPTTLPHKLSYLTEEDSLALLLGKAFQFDQPNKNFPPEIMNVAKQLVKKCGGLPSALIGLGSILSTKDCTYNAWHNVEQTMEGHNEDREMSSEVLVMSYNELPYHLKPCFLYFALFPKGQKISAKHITQMWIADGFIPQDGVKTLEDKAQHFLEELEQRCLIEVSERSWNGRCSYFNVRPTLHDLAIHAAKEDKFLTVFSKTDDETEHASQSDATKARRATLQFCIPTEYGVHSTKTRSLLCLGQCLSYHHGFKLLRVLTIERVDMRGKQLNETWLQGLVNLRYLGFRYCGRLPHEFGHISFSSLKKLETIDFKRTQIPDGPNDSLWEVQTLRHVIASNSKISFTGDPSKWDNLRNLQTLKWVNLQNIPELRFNINLREVGFFLDENIEFWKQGIEKAQKKLKGMLERMENLVSLSVISNIYVPLLKNSTSDLSCHKKIQCLHFLGKWPKGINLIVPMLPPNLAKFTLFGSKLQKDPMPVLKNLQSLRILQLRKDSYWGKELICSTGGFPSLQRLELSNLPRLNKWEIQEAAMPVLSQLQIWGCSELQAVPELGKVLTHQVLIESDLSEELLRKMQPEDQSKIRDIPTIQHGTPEPTDLPGFRQQSTQDDASPSTAPAKRKKMPVMKRTAVPQATSTFAPVALVQDDKEEDEEDSISLQRFFSVASY